jgi:hypothetical protein
MNSRPACDSVVLVIYMPTSSGTGGSADPKPFNGTDSVASQEQTSRTNLSRTLPRPQCLPPSGLLGRLPSHGLLRQCGGLVRTVILLFRGSVMRPVRADLRLRPILRPPHPVVPNPVMGAAELPVKFEVIFCVRGVMTPPCGVPPAGRLTYQVSGTDRWNRACDTFTSAPRGGSGFPIFPAVRIARICVKMKSGSVPPNPLS